MATVWFRRFRRPMVWSLSGLVVVVIGLWLIPAPKESRLSLTVLKDAQSTGHGYGVATLDDGSVGHDVSSDYEVSGSYKETVKKVTGELPSPPWKHRELKMTMSVDGGPEVLQVRTLYWRMPTIFEIEPPNVSVRAPDGGPGAFGKTEVRLGDAIPNSNMLRVVLLSIDRAIHPRKDRMEEMMKMMDGAREKQSSPGIQGGIR